MNDRVDQSLISMEQLIIENQQKQELELQFLFQINKSQDVIYGELFDYLRNSKLSSDYLGKNLIYLKESLNYDMEEHEQTIGGNALITQRIVIKEQLEQLGTQVKILKEPEQNGIPFKVLQNQYQIDSNINENTLIQGKRLLRERKKKIQTIIKHTVKKKNYYKRKLIKKEKCSICNARLVDFYGLVVHEQNYHNITRQPYEYINLKIEYND